MKIGITGGFGFIGSNRAMRLIDQNHDLVVIDDMSTGLQSNLKNSRFLDYKISILDKLELYDALKDCEVIVHLAARGSVPRSLKNPIATHEVNSTGTINVLEIARKNGAHVIYSSSSSVYGANDALPKNEKMWLAPKTPYAASKLSAESYVQSYSYSYGVPVTLLRFFNVYGPNQRPDHQYAAVIPKWIWKAIQGRSIDVYGDGTQTRDFTYVGTVVDVIEQSIVNKIYIKSAVNVAYGNNISLLTLVEELKQIFPNLSSNFLEPRLGDVKNSQNDPSLIKELFPSIRPIDFSVGLGMTVDWLKNNDFNVNASDLDID